MHAGANPGGGHGPPGHAFGGGGGGGWGGGRPAYSGPHGGPSASGTHYYGGGGGGGGSGGGGGGGDDCALPGECMLWIGYLKGFAALCLAVAGLGMVDAEDGLAFMPLTSTAAGLAGLAFISLDLAGSAFRKFWKKSVRTAHTKARGESASSPSATVTAADTTERVNRSADAACSTSRRAAHALFLAFMALIIFTLLPTRDIKGNLYARHAWGDGGRHLRAAATVATVAPGAQVRPRNGTEARARAPLPRSLEHAGGAPAERGPQSPVRKASAVPPAETETDRRVLTAVLDGSAFRARGNDSVRSGLAFVPEVQFGGLWHPVCGERGFEENLVGASILCQMFGLPVGKVVHGSPDAAPAPTPTGAFPIGRCEPGQALHQCSAYAAIMPTQDEHDGVLRDCKDHSGVAIKCFDASEAHRVCEADDPHSHHDVRVWHNGSGPRCLGCDMLDSGTGCVDHYAECSADFPWLEKIWADDGTLMECRDTREQRSGCRKAHCFFEDAGGFKAFLVAAWVSYFLGLGLLHCDAQHWYKRARSARKAALKLEQEKCEKKAAAVKDEPEAPAPLADRLQQLKDAHDRNLLNEEQYQAAVQQAVASVTL
eukprot:g2349.t1